MILVSPTLDLDLRLAPLLPLLPVPSRAREVELLPPVLWNHVRLVPFTLAVILNYREFGADKQHPRNRARTSSLHLPPRPLPRLNPIPDLPHRPPRPNLTRAVPPLVQDPMALQAFNLPNPLLRLPLPPLLPPMPPLHLPLLPLPLPLLPPLEQEPRWLPPLLLLPLLPLPPQLPPLRLDRAESTLPPLHPTTTARLDSERLVFLPFLGLVSELLLCSDRWTRTLKGVREWTVRRDLGMFRT
jgi:hypothetical protein